MRRKLNDLINQRSQKIEAAETALRANDKETYDSTMTEIRNMNSEIDRVQNLIQEQDRKFGQRTPNPAEQRDMAEELGRQLMNHEAVTITARDALNAVTLGTTGIVTPTGAPGTVNGPVDMMVSSIVDQVTTLDLTGLGSYAVPYEISGLEATAGKVEETAGKPRTESADPKFGIADIKPYDLTVTAFVDRNLARLTPVAYFQTVQAMAVRAARRKLAELIVNGDGGGAPVFNGITVAKNRAGEAISAALSVTAVNEDTLDELYFAYGSDDAIGAEARLLLTKKNLKAFGALRGTAEKQRLIHVVPNAQNPNTGTLENGGVILPYTLNSSVTDTKLIYGDPRNFTLGLFGPITLRLDESIKGLERMNTILVDGQVGGNVTVHEGFVVGTVGAGG